MRLEDFFRTGIRNSIDLTTGQETRILKGRFSTDPCILGQPQSL